MRKHPGEVREVPQVALRADPGASHQIVWGVWSGCPPYHRIMRAGTTIRISRSGGWPTARRRLTPRRGRGKSCAQKPSDSERMGRMAASPPEGQRPNAAENNAAQSGELHVIACLLVDVTYPKGKVRWASVPPGNTLLPGRVALQLPSCGCRGHRDQTLSPVG